MPVLLERVLKSGADILSAGSGGILPHETRGRDAPLTGRLEASPTFRSVAGVSILALVLSSQAVTALEWKSAQGYRVAELPMAKNGKTGFTQMPGKETGIFFTHLLKDER